MEKRKEEEEEGKKEEKERKGEEEGNKKLKANFESRHNESKLGFGFLLWILTGPAGDSGALAFQHTQK